MFLMSFVTSILGGGLKKWLLLCGVVAIVATLLFGYMSYNNIKNENLNLRTANIELSINNQTLKDAISTNEEVIRFLEKEATRVRENYERASQEIAETRKQNNALRNRIRNLNVGKIAIDNPTETEVLLNKSTSDSFRCFELLSGGELNENERKATNAKEFNSECPWLFNPN
jgi:FtsZ-interacting cell division protein ZipA